MSQLYQRLRAVCHSWPVDITKDGRDFGQYLRKKLISVCKEGEKTELDVAYWEPRIAALERLRDDVHLKEFYTEYKPASNKDFDDVVKNISNQIIINPVRIKREEVQKKLKALEEQKT